MVSIAFVGENGISAFFPPVTASFVLSNNLLLFSKRITALVLSMIARKERILRNSFVTSPVS